MFSYDLPNMEKLDKFAVFTKLFQNKKHSHKHNCKWTALDHGKGFVTDLVESVSDLLYVDYLSDDCIVEDYEPVQYWKINKNKFMGSLPENPYHIHHHQWENWLTLEARCSPPNFNTDNVRLVVILRSHNTSCGRVLYDSKSEPRPNTNAQCCKRKGLFKTGRCPEQHGEDVSMPCGKPRPRLASDIKMLEEVMFGSAPMVQKGSSLKVHSMRNPPQLMVTKVFMPASSNKGPSVEHESFDLYSVQSMSVDSLPKHISLPEHPGPTAVAQSVPVDVPMPSKRHSDDTEDSGISASLASSCSSSFTTSGYSPSSSASLSSINSLTRRLLRNQTTSFEYSFAKRLSDESGELLRSSRRPPCLGFGITFTLPEENTDTFRGLVIDCISWKEKLVL
ncbi:hypothetical protein LSH36_217g01016 [Paralvinella palmiformis]|uniref:UDENN FNIP1/2-type domain-containing protein n=1 Tax=Paralvinella palmiformis TaxID=53620 RepID=A0AAD9JP03_9ANNE|nr:hypothetical protein LSH36_217g01016 [Paralvinella palmiformis]